MPILFRLDHGGALAQLVAATMNANVGGRDHGAVYVERQVIAWFRDLFGFPETSSGLLVGGTSMVVQSKAGPADLAKLRTTIDGLHLGEAQLQQFGAPTDVLIRIPEQPGGDQAQQDAVKKVQDALGDEVTYQQVDVVGPRISTEFLAKGTIGLMLAIVAILVYLWVRFEWQFALGAMIAKSDVAASLTPGSHGTTFGGNPVSCAAGLAMVETIDEERVLENATRGGGAMLERLREIAKTWERITEVRGLGMMIGVVLKHDARPVVDACLKERLLVNGTAGNVLRLLPPLNLSRADAERGLAIVERALRTAPLPS